MVSARFFRRASEYGCFPAAGDSGDPASWAGEESNDLL